jgi:hypothetical protein
MRILLWLAALVGGVAGVGVPLLLGAGPLVALGGGAVGGFAGIYAGYRVGYRVQAARLQPPPADR